MHSIASKSHKTQDTRPRTFCLLPGLQWAYLFLQFLPADYESHARPKQSQRGASVLLIGLGQSCARKYQRLPPASLGHHSKSVAGAPTLTARALMWMELIIVEASGLTSTGSPCVVLRVMVGASGAIEGCGESCVRLEGSTVISGKRWCFGESSSRLSTVVNNSKSTTRAGQMAPDIFV